MSASGLYMGTLGAITGVGARFKQTKDQSEQTRSCLNISSILIDTGPLQEALSLYRTLESKHAGLGKIFLFISMRDIDT